MKNEFKTHITTLSAIKVVTLSEKPTFIYGRQNDNQKEVRKWKNKKGEKKSGGKNYDD